MRAEAKAEASRKAKELIAKKKKEQLELDDKMLREEKMLKDFEDADKEEATKVNNDYFAIRKSVSETAFDDMKQESLAEVST